MTELLSVVDRPATFSETAHYNGFQNSHNVFLNEETGFAYAVGTGNSDENLCPLGLHMIDVRNPNSPTFAGCFNADGYTHDVQCKFRDLSRYSGCHESIVFASCNPLWLTSLSACRRGLQRA